MVTRGDQPQRVAGAALLDQLDEQIAQRERFSPYLARIGPYRDVQPAADQGQGHDRLGSAQEPADPGRRLVPVLHRERPGVPPPAGHRRPEPILVATMHPDERGGARTAVQVLVRAPDREVGVGTRDVDRQRPRRMGQIPDDQRAVIMSPGGDADQVPERTGAVVDLREHHHRHVGAEQIVQVMIIIDQPELVAAVQQRDQTLGDVEVGGEVVPFGHDHPTPGMIDFGDPQRRRQHLEQVERGGVGHHGLAGPTPDDHRQLVTQLPGQAEPVRSVPAPDQPGTPLVLDHPSGHL